MAPGGHVAGDVGPGAEVTRAILHRQHGRVTPCTLDPDEQLPIGSSLRGRAVQDAARYHEQEEGGCVT